MAKFLGILSLTMLAVSSLSAQFDAGSKNINGSLNWSQSYYAGSSIGSVVNVLPSFEYFVADRVAVIGSVSVTAFRFNGIWLVDDGNLGLGGKYYYTVDQGAVYGGAALNLSGVKPPRSLVMQAGFLFGLGKGVFLDNRLEFTAGLGDNKLSTVLLGVGIETFF